MAIFRGRFFLLRVSYDFAMQPLLGVDVAVSAVAAQSDRSFEEHIIVFHDREVAEEGGAADMKFGAERLHIHALIQPIEQFEQGNVFPVTCGSLFEASGVAARTIIFQNGQETLIGGKADAASFTDLFGDDLFGDAVGDIVKAEEIHDLPEGGGFLDSVTLFRAGIADVRIEHILVVEEDAVIFRPFLFWHPFETHALFHIAPDSSPISLWEYSDGTIISRRKPLGKRHRVLRHPHV